MSRLIEGCILATILVASVMLSACGGGAPIELSDAALGTTVDAKVDEDIDITLRSVGGGEYSAPAISSNSIRFLNVSLPSAQGPGGETQEFHFRAENAGTAVITIPHTEKSPFDVTIVVR